MILGKDRVETYGEEQRVRYEKKGRTSGGLPVGCEGFSMRERVFEEPFTWYVNVLRIEDEC